MLPDGICYPVRNVLCLGGVVDHLQNVSDGFTKPVAPRQIVRAIADATFRQDARINIHLSSRDLRALQVRALTEGIPFEMLVASVLHKFVDGQLVEKPSV